MAKGYKKNQKNTDKFQAQGKGATWVRIRKEEAYRKLVIASRQNYEIDSRVKEFLSDDSLEVVTHFVYEAPGPLNADWCAPSDGINEANVGIRRLGGDMNNQTVG